MDESNPLGFISIKENNPYTAEIYVMGVLPDYHNQGIGLYLAVFYNGLKKKAMNFYK